MPLPTQWTLDLALDDADDDEAVRRRSARKLRMSDDALPELVVLKRSIDARHGRVRVHLLVAARSEASIDEAAAPPREVVQPERIAIVGDGPAGLFCAYELARAGIGCVVFDRGKKVQPRRRDLKSLQQDGVVDEDSNYCFGEGGAGTYSDGKLYTRSHKRGDVRDVLELLVEHGAPSAVLTDARPHIGSNKLPRVVTALRERLEQVGVQFEFGATVTSISRDESGRARGLKLADGSERGCDAVVLATGHSARDVYEWLAEAGVALEPKGFAVGVRIEHPQPLIDGIQYGRAAGHPKLPSAPYHLAHTRDGRGVFSFCMCPGGFIVPAATMRDELVVNGMSLSKRDSPYANSGLVVGIEPDDVSRAGYGGVLAGVEYQRRLESLAATAGGGTLRAPATRATDFRAGRPSTTLAPSSYQPGLMGSDIAAVLDGAGIPIAARLRDALDVFDRRMRGYVTEEANLVGVESRTSAPLRIPRRGDTLECLGIDGLYPCGEGAGYAGGIVSAALDGLRVARALIDKLPSP